MIDRRRELPKCAETVGFLKRLPTLFSGPAKDWQIRKKFPKKAITYCGQTKVLPLLVIAHKELECRCFQIRHCKLRRRVLLGIYQQEPLSFR
jgi:hypothetical protein